jgi:hypothetical protein
VINGALAGDLAGYSLSSAGDVNGDGLADLIVGASQGGVSTGKVYVVFGTTSNATINLSALGAGGFVIDGPAGGLLGLDVANAGDINGDGLADLLVGDVRSNTNKGTTYVVYGKTSTAAINVTSLTAGSTNGFVISGQNASDGNSGSVSSAGDVNGDGFADLIVGAAGVDGTASGAGASYIIYGGPQYVTGNLALGIGTSADELVLGTDGADTLKGNGGVDRFSAGRGNDTIVLQASDVTNLANNTVASVKANVDGGEGLDTIQLMGGASLDLTAISNVGAGVGESLSRISSIERIDMAADTGANTTTIRLNDVIDMSGMNLFHTGTSGLGAVSGTALGATVQKHQVMITGDASDTANIGLSNWSNTGTVVSYENHNYVVYNASNGAAAQLLIDQAMVNAAGHVI